MKNKDTKWNSVLDYESNDCPKLPDEKREAVREELERMEKLILNTVKVRCSCGALIEDKEASYQLGCNVARLLIPQVRRNEGPLEIITIDGEEYYKYTYIFRDTTHHAVKKSFEDVCYGHSSCDGGYLGGEGVRNLGSEGGWVGVRG